MTDKLSCSRESDRTRVIMRATVFAADGARQARVRDLSLSGAQLAVDGPLPINRDVIFKRGEIFAAARVVWSDERLTGLRFYRDLQPDELDSSFRTLVKA